MPIRAYLNGAAFGPDMIAEVSTALEAEVCDALPQA
jgi:hypothetical protein